MAATGPTPAQVLGRVTLLTGKEEFFSERTVAQVRDAVRAYDPEAELAETGADQLTLAALGDLAAPSLFSSTRCVVVRRLEDLPGESEAGLLEYAGEPAEDVALVLVHSGGQRGSGTLTKLRKVATVHEVKAPELKPWEYAKFVSSEVAAHGQRIDEDAAGTLVRAVGQDPRGLAAAVDQLVHDFAGERLSDDKVRRYFGGRAEAKSFAVADHALQGRRAEALEELRWALEAGTAAVLVTSAFASSARSLAKFLAAGSGQRDQDLAKQVGVPPWKVRALRDQARHWSPEQVAGMLRAVAAADADVKGAASDPPYTLERLVLTVTGLRDARS